MWKDSLRNIMRHLLEIYSGRESRPRTEQACTTNGRLSTIVLSSTWNRFCMDNLFVNGHLSFVFEMERQF